MPPQSTKFPRLIPHLLILFASILMLSQAEGADARQPASTSQDKVIVVLGDSLGAAYGIPPAKGWVALVADKLKEGSHPYKIINESISGDTTGGGLQRLPDILRRDRVSLLVLELGGNDGLRSFPLNVMKDNLVGIIQMANQAEAQVLLLGVTLPNNYGTRYKRAFADAYRAVAEQEKIPFLPNLLQKVPLEEEYFLEDRVHPAVIAQPIIADTVWQALVKLL